MRYFHSSFRWFPYAILAFGLSGLIGACATRSASQPVDHTSPTSPSRLRDEPEARRPILFLLSSTGTQTLRNGKERRTGTFLSEFYEPYSALIQDGYGAVIATPRGENVAIDPEGMLPKYWESEKQREDALEFSKSDPTFLHPIDFELALDRVNEWAGLVLPGGQGIMTDIVPNPLAHELVLELTRQDKPVGLICHAPALLKHLPREENPLLGRSVTSVSPFEEFYIETFVMGGKALDRRIGRQLRQAGYDYDSALPKADHAIRDGNLVTSQNPFSGSAFEREFREALLERERSDDGSE